MQAEKVEDEFMQNRVESEKVNVTIICM